MPESIVGAFAQNSLLQGLFFAVIFGCPLSLVGPERSFSALSATAAAIGAFPVAGVALLLGADRLMHSLRVVVNLLGNCVATFVV